MFQQAITPEIDIVIPNAPSKNTKWNFQIIPSQQLDLVKSVTENECKRTKFKWIEMNDMNTGDASMQIRTTHSSTPMDLLFSMKHETNFMN